MKRLNCNYNITFSNGNTRKGNISYSLSHYVAFLFKQGLQRNIISNFWNNYKYLLNNQGGLYLNLITGNYTNISQKYSVTLFRILHCIGYYIFEKEINPYPNIVYIGNKFCLYDQNNNIMTFGYSKNYNHISCNKRFHAYFQTNNSNLCIFVGSNCNVNIVDPEINKKSKLEYFKYEDAIKQIIDDNEEKIINISDNNIKISIGISKYENENYRKSNDKYFDGQLYFYILRDYKISNYICYEDETNTIVSLISTEKICLCNEKYLAFKNKDLSQFSDKEIDTLFNGLFIHCFKDEHKFYKNKLHQLNENHY